MFSSSGWANVQNGTALDASKITCNDGYSRTLITSFSCTCAGNGQACATITACQPNACTAPVVAQGTFAAGGWTDQSDGDTLVASKITCNAGYHRSSVAAFTCACAVDGQPCAGITDACDIDNGALGGGSRCFHCSSGPMD